VLYKADMQGGETLQIRSPGEWPDPGNIQTTYEMWAKVNIITPQAYMGGVLELLGSTRSLQKKIDYVGPEKVELVYELPLLELFTRNFYDKLKSSSQGFASLNYELLDFRQADLVKLDILILGKREETLSKIIPESETYREGKAIVEKLKEHLPPQLFAVPLQAAVGGKVIARETISAKRRDVTAPLYGGDYSRKKKLLEKQKAGKKELQEKGRVRIPHEVLLKIFRL
jgi:GTP-binding protein LepA